MLMTLEDMGAPAVGVAWLGDARSIALTRGSSQRQSARRLVERFTSTGAGTGVISGTTGSCDCTLAVIARPRALRVRERDACCVSRHTAADVGRRWRPTRPSAQMPSGALQREAQETPPWLPREQRPPREAGREPIAAMARGSTARPSPAKRAPKLARTSGDRNDCGVTGREAAEVVEAADRAVAPVGAVEGREPQPEGWPGRLIVLAALAEAAEGTPPGISADGIGR